MSHFIRDMHIEQWLSYKTMLMGKECGEYCDHWFDPDHYHSLFDAHKQHEYKDRCFMPMLIISPIEGKVKVQVKCNSNSYLRFHHSPLSKPELFCKKQFPILEKLLEEEFNKFLAKKHE